LTLIKPTSFSAGILLILLLDGDFVGDLYSATTLDSDSNELIFLLS